MNKENKKIMNPSFDEVIKLDRSLQFLASYDVSGGKIVLPKTMEEMSAINVKIANKFNYFKKLIHDGECTFEYIKNTVLSKNGPYPQNKKPIDFDSPDCLQEFEEPAPQVAEDNVQSLVEKMLGSLFPGVSVEKIEVKDIAASPCTCSECMKKTESKQPEQKLIPPVAKKKKRSQKKSKDE